MKQHFYLRKAREIDPRDYSSNTTMEIINKKHEKIFANQRVKLDSYIKIERGRKAFYFSAGASRLFGLIPGLKINFINDGSEWFFYCDSDKDGFELIERNGKNSSLICDAHLVDLFMKSTRSQEGTKYPISITKSEHNCCPVFKIELNKPF